MSGQPLGMAMVAAAFLLGAVPWGFLAGRLRGGIDLRTVGSGGTGATNVLRTLGARISAIVFVLDFLKGLLPVLAAKSLGLAPEWVAATAVATVIGHCWSPFIGFHGGKGVATGAGATIGLYPPAILLLLIMALVVWTTRYVSLGSLTVAILAAIVGVALAASGVVNWAFALAVLAIAAIIVVRHGGNIERLRNGTERRLGQPVQT